jgi:hypothetical protein
MKARVAQLAATASLLLLAGCGGGASSLLGLPSGGGSCSPHTVSLTFPSTGGYSASGQLTSATQCFSTATVTTSASTSPILGSPFVSSDPSAQVLVYLGIKMSATEYASGLPSLTITLPAGVTTTNRKFYVAYNYGAGSSFSWSATAEGPATASGATVSFGSGSGNTTFQANEESELAIYSVAGP